jgi:hypothetical protein
VFGHFGSPKIFSPHVNTPSFRLSQTNVNCGTEALRFI